jgi:transcriptional regulator with XRE-family HTH domain
MILYANNYKEDAMSPDEIKKWRVRDMNVSQKEAGKLLGVSSRQISAYENAETDVPQYIFLSCLMLLQLKFILERPEEYSGSLPDSLVKLVDHLDSVLPPKDSGKGRPFPEHLQRLEMGFDDESDEPSHPHE